MFKSLISLLLLVTAATPTISTPDQGKTFKIGFERGAVWSCVVYRMVEPTESKDSMWPDGHYAPRSCGEVNVHATSYIEEWNKHIFDPKTGLDYNVDWDVYAFLQYPVAGKNDEFVYVETPRVRVRR